MITDCGGSVTGGVVAIGGAGFSKDVLLFALKRFFLLPAMLPELALAPFCGDVTVAEAVVETAAVVVVSVVVDDDKLKLVILAGSVKITFHSDKSDRAISSGNDSRQSSPFVSSAFSISSLSLSSLQ